MDLSVLTNLVDTSKLGGWIRAGVGAGIAALIAKWPALKDVLDPATQTALAVAASGLVVGVWSHVAKSVQN